MRSDAQPEPVDGAVLLDGLSRLIGRFVVMTAAEADVVALWVVHTWAIAAADYTPYLAVTSAEKRSGKSRLLEVLNLLVRDPVRQVVMTAATMYRLLAEKPYAMLCDEIDAIFGEKAKAHEDLRGIINAGFKRGTRVPRCVGEGTKQKVEWFETFGPKVLAGLGELPDTIADRSLPIRLRRKAPGEAAARLRESRPPAEFAVLREAARAWAEEHQDALGLAEPVLPDELDDRAQDVCEPLIAIADIAGGQWPVRGREALIALRNNGGAVTEETIGIRLLADIRRVFDVLAARVPTIDRISTEELLAQLGQDKEAPWQDFRGAGLNARAMATLLSRYGISSKQIRFTAELGRKGYRRSDFEDAFGRYLPPTPENETSETDTRVQAPEDADVSDVSDYELREWADDASEEWEVSDEEIERLDALREELGL